MTNTNASIAYAPPDALNIRWEIRAFNNVTGEPILQMDNPPILHFIYGQGPYSPGRPVPVIMIVMDGRITEQDQRLITEALRKRHEPEMQFNWAEFGISTLGALLGLLICYKYFTRK